MLEKIMQTTWKTMPTWRCKGPSKIHTKTIQKTSRKMMQKWSGRKPFARRGAEGPMGLECWKRYGVPLETPGQGSLLHQRNIIKKTNIRQQLKSNALEPLAPPRMHLTCRQARCGSINLLGPRPSWHWCAIGSSMAAPALSFHEPGSQFRSK